MFYQFLFNFSLYRLIEESLKNYDYLWKILFFEKNFLKVALKFFSFNAQAFQLNEQIIEENKRTQINKSISYYSF